MKYEKEEALRMLDSSWDDSRNFAFQYFEDNFEEQDWTPSLLISICDSVREDVQIVGRRLITKFFAEKDGEEYLLNLSQHPKATLQLFATNYLARFAQDDIEKLEKLQHYFITVLSQVNKSRVAKERVLTFLHTEALKSEAAAKLIAPILTRQSVTMAITDKARLLEIMRDIHAIYGNLDLPIEVKEIPTVA